MRWKLTFAVLSLTLLLGAPALAQVKFERKIQEGKTYTVEETAKMSQKLTIAGMDIESSADTQSTSKVTTGKRDASGQIKLEEKISSMQAQIKAAGSEYLFDSANPDKTGESTLEGMRKIHQVHARRKTTKTFDKENKLIKIEYDENALNDVADEIRNLVKDQYDPEKVKKAETDEAGQLPDKAVAKGESWDHTIKSNLGAGQVFTVASKFTYEGEVEKGGRKLDKITYTIKSVDFTLEDSPLPFTLKSSDLKPTDAKGEILFDRMSGMIVESKVTTGIKGDIVFVINGTELPSKLELKMETSTVRKE